MAEELSDTDVMQPLPAGTLSDDEVMAPPKREGGLLQAIPELFHTVPKAAELLGTPQGRAALVNGVQKFGEGLLDLFKIPGKAVSEGVTPEQESEFGVNVALAGIPGTKAIFPIAKAFEQGIMRPAVDRLTPQMPEAVAPVVGSDVPRGVSRSELAVTGEPHVDAVLNSEVTKKIIDEPLIDRSHSVPYTAGGSVPLDDPTTFIDWRFPHLMEVNGKVFDPADPFTIHENVEQHTMELLTKAGMSDEVAYRVAHFEFAEKAEAAWYEAHGISKEDAEAAYAPIMAEIQRTAPAPGPPIVQFRRDAVAIEKSLPAPQDGFSRLWRGNRPGEVGKATSFTNSLPGIALPFRKGYGGDLSYIDVPTADLAKYESHGAVAPGAEFNLPQELAREAKTVAVPQEPSIPSNLYKRPYPHDQPSAARNEAIAEARPSEAEIAQAKDIIAGAQERGELNPSMAEPTTVEAPQPAPTETDIKVPAYVPAHLREDWIKHKRQILEYAKPRQPVDVLAGLRQAREFGIIGPDKAPVATDSPARAAQRAIPTARQDDKITMTPAGEPVDAFQQRFKKWVDKIDAPEAVRDMIDQTAAENDHFPEARAGEVSPAHVEAVAEAAGMDPSKIDRGGLSTRFNNPTKIRMVEQALLQTTEDVRGLAAEVTAGETPQNLIALQQAIIRRDYVLEYTLGLRAEWGKSGLALQEILREVKDQEGLTSFLRDKGRSVDDLRDIARGLQGLDRESAARVLSNARDQRPGWFYWIWQQGLISGLITHTKYLTVNTSFVYAERVVAPAMAALLGKLHGGEKVFLGEPIVAHLGLIRAVPNAFRSAGEAFRTGMRVPLAGEIALEQAGKGSATPYGSPSAPNWGIWQRVFNDEKLAKASNALGVFGKSANAIHTFYKVISEGASAESRAYNMAAKEGHAPLSDDFWSSYAYHRENPTEANLNGAVEDAYSGAFMEKLGKKTGEWARVTRENPVLKWIFPFQHIPLNIERQTIRYTPAAFLGPEMRAAIMGEKGNIAQDLAIAKMAVGGAVMGYFIHKILSGDGTGDYPMDQKERDDWKLQGKIPNSVKMGDQWVQLERLGPAGNLAKIGLNLGDIISRLPKDFNDEGLSAALAKATGHAMHAAANQIGDEVGFQSLRNMIDAWEEPSKFPRFAAYQAGSFIPASSFVSQTASYLDPEMRKANDLISGLKYRIPFLRETLAPTRDPLYGELVHNPGFHSIMRVTPVNRDPVKAELEAVDYHPTAPTPHIAGVKLTPEQFDRYQATAGPLVKEALTALVQQPGWSDVPAELRKETLQKTVKTMRAMAAQSMLMDQPQIIESARQARFKRMGLAN